jgi:putative tryptophan/tyrosine transport system substrate-binding protein
MRRRQFLVSAGAMALTAGNGASAQPQSVAVVGFLNSASPGPYAQNIAGFRRGLRDTGYVEGRNLAIEFRWAESRLDQLPALAADLVSRRVSVIATGGGPAPALAVKAATATIPIVFTLGSDPVKVGLVANLARPERNLTGVTFLTAGLNSKRLDLLHQLVPKARRVAFLLNPNNPDSSQQLADVTATARAVGLPIVKLQAADRAGLEAALSAMKQTDADTLLVGADPLFDNWKEKIIEQMARLAVPAIYEESSFTRVGGLISCGADVVAAYDQAGGMSVASCRGQNPAICRSRNRQSSNLSSI